jgi:D-sedoheptulose 7-phosphate isomerase
MTPEEKIIALFRESIEVHANHGEFVANQLSVASELLAGTFIQGSHVLVCGQAVSSINAQYLVVNLLNQGSRERPGFPAHLLDSNATLLAAIGQSYGANEILSRQISALGREGDVLVVFTTTGASQSLVNAVQAAHKRKMPVILFSGNEGGHVAQLLDGDDIEIRVSAASEFLIQEVHLLMTHGLCELVDDLLFGGRSDA